MTLLDKLNKMATLMHFSGNRGYGWYARPIGAENVWGFGPTVEEACDSALALPTDKHVPCMGATPPPPPVRRRVIVEDEPPVRRRPTLFDDQ